MASIYERVYKNGNKTYWLNEWVNGKPKLTYLGTKPPIRRSRGWTNLPQDVVDWIKRQRQTPGNIRQTLTLPSNGKYRTIVIDPPWPIEEIQLRARSKEDITPYATIPLSIIKKGTGPIPIKRLTDKQGCHIFLWTTQKYLQAGFEVLECWGFRHIFTMVWHKNAGMQPFNLPQYNCEFVLFGRKGNLPFLDTRNFQTCFYSLRREHSRKPDEFYKLVARVSPIPRLDMFSREPHDWFDQYGNEASKYQDNKDKAH